MNEETVVKLQEVFTPVAEKIGSGAEFVWDVLVWGQFAEGVATLATLALTGLILFGTFTFCSRRYDWVRRPEDGYLFGMIASGLMMVIWFLFASIGLYEGTLKLVAPEYTAIKMLIGLVN